MDAHDDDELDKLIQETQDIWKSLKNSGVELKDDSQIDDNVNNTNNTNNNNSININSNSSNNNSRTVLDDLDKIKTKLDNSTLNIIHQTNNNDESSNSIEENNSRTLQGLNLATPTNELSSFLLNNNNSTSRISQIKFSTPSYKLNKNNKNISCGTGNNNSSLISSIPHTPYLFSPSLSLPNTIKKNNNNNITLSPSITEINNNDTNITTTATNTEKEEKEKEINKIDFNENCWHQINELLSTLGFAVLMKEHNNNFEEISPKIIICNRFREILNKYQNIENKLNECSLQNNQFKKQLNVSNDKILNLKNEIRDIKQQNEDKNENNNKLLLNIKKQLKYSQNILLNKNNEILKLKKKLNENIEKEAIKKESIETIFKSLNKRNSKKNNKKDQKTLDIMQIYEDERKKMQNEIKFLRKEMINLNKRFQKENDGDNQNKSKKKKKKMSSNISFCASTRESSDDDDDVVDGDDDGDNDDDDDDEVLINLKWNKKQKEISKTKTNRNDIERIKDLNRLETSELRNKLNILIAEKDSIRSNLSNQKDINSKLNIELSKRPSLNEWTRLRNELNTMNKELIETRKVASLRKYMDTRELIKRDREIHKLNLLNNINTIPKEIMSEILIDLCRILKINDITILVKSIKKLTKCIECLPVLEQYISSIIRLLLTSDHASELIKIYRISPQNVFDRVVPILKEWIIKLDKITVLTTFRQKISSLLKKRTITAAATGDNDSDDMLALHEIIKQINELIESEEYLLITKKNYDCAEKNIISNPSEISNRIVKHFQHIFSIKNIEGVFPKMNQLYLEINEKKNLIKTIKSILGLPQNSKINLCLKELQKIIKQPQQSQQPSQSQSQPQQSQQSQLLNDIKKLLQCSSENDILIQIKELINRCLEYDAVFPRVHNLVNQLRTTLGVEYAHQILPKVKQLVVV